MAYNQEYWLFFYDYDYVYDKPQQVTASTA